MQSRREALLFILSFTFIAGSYLALTLAPSVRQAAWGAAGFQSSFVIGLTLWSVCAYLGHFVLNRKAPFRDAFLFPVAMFLVGWGLVLIQRLAPGFGVRQSLWLFIGTLVLVGVLFAPPDLRWLRRFPYLWLTSGLLLTALTLVVGTNPSGEGPRLWLGCCGPGSPGGGLYLQPSEILKLLLVVYLAAYLAEKGSLIVSEHRFGPIRLPTSFFMPLFVMWGFSLLLLMSQRDLGTGSLLFGIFLAMVFLAIGRVEYLVAGVLLLGVSGLIAYQLFDVVQVRVNALWNPWVDASGDSFQIVQSLIAIANGGFAGRGPGLGAPRVIPVVHSDFIFAAVVEEWGLLGGLGMLLLILLFVLRGLRLATLLRLRFHALLAGGLAATIGIQAILIVGGVIRALPLTGVTLPFVSYGGSALIMQFAALGLLLRLSDRAHRGLF